MEKIIIWDFDGTLAEHDGMWSGSMITALEELVIDHNTSCQSIRALLETGFPWHTPDKSHHELSKDNAWWHYMEEHLTQIFVRLGYRHELSALLAKKTHETFVNINRYKVFPGTFSVLESLKNKGWKNIILSNHVPELPRIVEQIGLGRYIEKCFTSARIGYEKPNINAFRYVLNRLEEPEPCIMIGDNEMADVKGAQEAGMEAILLNRKCNKKEGYCCKRITDIEIIIEKIENRIRKEKFDAT